MKRLELFQVDLFADLDGPIAHFHRWDKNHRARGKFHTYRARDIDSPSAKARFIRRVTALQMALCKAA